MLTMWVRVGFLLFLFQIAFSSLPKLDDINPKREQNVGSKLKIFCASNQGSRPFSFEWYKNGLPLSSTKYQIETSEDDSLFVIDKLTKEDSGNYFCIVHNHFGSDTLFTNLIVKGLTFFSLNFILIL